jgi:hypothetical protein
MFTQFLETEQIAIPVLLGRHIGFRPTRPGEVGKRFPIITLSLILLWGGDLTDRCRSAVRLAGRLTAGMSRKRQYSTLGAPVVSLLLMGARQGLSGRDPARK